MPPEDTQFTYVPLPDIHQSNREQADNTLTLERLRSLFERLSFEANWSQVAFSTRYQRPARPVEQQPQRNPNCRAFPHRSNP